LRIKNQKAAKAYRLLCVKVRKIGELKSHSDQRQMFSEICGKLGGEKLNQSYLILKKCCNVSISHWPACAGATMFRFLIGQRVLVQQCFDFSLASVR
jgi:hypothetical protein